MIISRGNFPNPKFRTYGVFRLPENIHAKLPILIGTRGFHTTGFLNPNGMVGKVAKNTTAQVKEKAK